MSKLLSCKFTSEYDSLAWRHLYGFETEKEYYTALSSSFIDKRLDIPFLAVQPRDDPLHSVSASYCPCNIHIELSLQDMILFRVILGKIFM